MTDSGETRVMKEETKTEESQSMAQRAFDLLQVLGFVNEDTYHFLIDWSAEFGELIVTRASFDENHVVSQFNTSRVPVPKKQASGWIRFGKTSPGETGDLGTGSSGKGNDLPQFPTDPTLEDGQ